VEVRGNLAKQGCGGGGVWGGEGGDMASNEPSGVNFKLMVPCIIIQC